MLIVSQDERTIINFNNEIIELDANEKTIGICISTSSNYVILGKYKTNERSKEVLKEIVMSYQKDRDKDNEIEVSGKIDGFYKIFNAEISKRKSVIYYMPKE